MRVEGYEIKLDLNKPYTSKAAKILRRLIA